MIEVAGGHIHSMADTYFTTESKDREYDLAVMDLGKVEDPQPGQCRARIITWVDNKPEPRYVICPIGDLKEELEKLIETV